MGCAECTYIALHSSVSATIQYVPITMCQHLPRCLHKTEAEKFPFHVPSLKNNQLHYHKY